MNYGMLQLEKRPIDISELLIQLEEELYPLLEKKDLEARLNIATPIYLLTVMGNY